MKLTRNSVKALKIAAFTSLIALSSCSKDDNQQEEIVVEEYSQQEYSQQEDTELNETESNDSVEADSQSQDEQSPESYSLDEQVADEESTNDSELDEIVIPSTDEAEEVSEEHNKMAVNEEVEDTETESIEQETTEDAAPMEASRNAEQNNTEYAKNAAQGEARYYIVKPEDNLGKISQKLYGTSKKWKQLASENDLSNPNKLYPGDVIKYQVNQEVAQNSTNLSNPKTYVVGRGETLSKISKNIYGSAQYWKVIYRWNEAKITSPQLIYPNQKIQYYSKEQLTTSTDNFDRKTHQFAH